MNVSFSLQPTFRFLLVNSKDTYKFFLFYSLFSGALGSIQGHTSSIPDEAEYVDQTIRDPNNTAGVVHVGIV